MQTASDSHSECRKNDLISNASVPSKNNTFEKAGDKLKLHLKNFMFC